LRLLAGFEFLQRLVARPLRSYTSFPRLAFLKGRDPHCFRFPLQFLQPTLGKPSLIH
jgi:hypothetical protein